MISRRQESLIREIAGLFVKYSISDWSPIVEGLKNSGPIHSDLALAIDQLVTHSEELRSRNKKITKKSNDQRSIRSERVEVIEPLRSALLSRHILPRASDLREVAYAIGLKDVLPAPRSQSIDAIIGYINELPERKYVDSLEILKNFVSTDKPRFEDEYRRWFEVILSSVNQNDKKRA